MEANTSKLHSKQYKVTIDKITTKDFTIDLNDTFLTIQAQGSEQRKISINQIVGFTFTCEGNRFIKVNFILEKPHPNSLKVLIKVGSGQLNVNIFDDSFTEEIIENCNVCDLMTKKPIFMLRIKIFQDLQNRAYQLPESQVEEELEESMRPVTPEDEGLEQSEGNLATISENQTENNETALMKNDPQEAPKAVWQSPKKTRRKKYKVLNEGEESIRIYKTLQDGDTSHYLLQNFHFVDLDQPIYQLKLFGNNKQNALAEVSYSRSPTSEQIATLKMQIDPSINKIFVTVETLENTLFKGFKKLPNLKENESRRVIVPMKDETDLKDMSVMFNYKTYDESKTLLAQQKLLSQNYEKYGPSDFQQNEEKFGYLTNVQKFNKPPTVVSPQIFQTISHPEKDSKALKKSKLIKYSQPAPKASTSILPQIPEKKRYNTIQKAYNINIGSPQKKISCGTQKTVYPEELGDSLLKKPRRKTETNEQSQTQFDNSSIRNYMKNMKNSGAIIQHKGKIIKIKTVNIKFYKSYFQGNGINLEKEALISKSLNIFSDRSKIYRSPPTYGQLNLTWILNDCCFVYDELSNLCCQLNYDREQTNIGEVKVSQNQIRYLSSIGDDFSGYLTKNNEPIAKINMSFQVLEGQSSPKHKRTYKLKKSVQRQNSRIPSNNKYQKQNTTEDVKSFRQSDKLLSVPLPQRKRKNFRVCEIQHEDTSRVKLKTRKR